MAGALVFDRLPRDEQSHHVAAVSAQPGEVQLGLVEREGPADEADGRGVLKEALLEMRTRALRRACRVFARACQIDAAQGQHSALGVYERIPIRARPQVELRRRAAPRTASRRPSLLVALLRPKQPRRLQRRLLGYTFLGYVLGYVLGYTPQVTS